MNYVVPEHLRIGLPKWVFGTCFTILHYNFKNGIILIDSNYFSINLYKKKEENK